MTPGKVRENPARGLLRGIFSQHPNPPGTNHPSKGEIFSDNRKNRTNRTARNPGIFRGNTLRGRRSRFKGPFSIQGTIPRDPTSKSGKSAFMGRTAAFLTDPQPQPKNSPFSEHPHPKGCDARHISQCNLHHSPSHARARVYARVLLRGRTCIRAHGRMYARTYARIMRASARWHARARTS